MSNKNFNRKEQKLNVVVDENIINNKNMNNKNFDRKEQKLNVVVDENIIDNKDNTHMEPTTYIGQVVNYTKLNLRQGPDINTEVLSVLNREEEVKVDKEHSTDEFYKVTNSNGIEGYCMKQYINVLDEIL